MILDVTQCEAFLPPRPVELDLVDDTRPNPALELDVVEDTRPKDAAEDVRLFMKERISTEEREYTILRSFKGLTN